MTLKRVINTVVTITALLVISAVLIIGITYFGEFLQYLNPYKPVSITARIFDIVVTILSFVMFVALLAAVSYIPTVISDGHGLLWRRVDSGDVLLNPDRSIFKKFYKTDFVWRWDPMFNNRILIG